MIRSWRATGDTPRGSQEQITITSLGVALVGDLQHLGVLIISTGAADREGFRIRVLVNRRHDDLDALAGSWRKIEGVDFERATAPFGKVDPKLWK